MPSTTDGVGFILPKNTRSNATNLVTPGFFIDLSVDPWSILADPDYGVPMTPQQQAEWQKLVCQRYGQPTPGANVLPLPGTAMHSDAFKSALEAIAQLDPGWFQREGYGPGPAGRNGISTQLEIHDAQYAPFCQEVVDHSAQIQGAPVA
jgi:hypothetical protein